MEALLLLFFGYVISGIRGVIPEGGSAPPLTVSLFAVVIGKCLGNDIAEKQQE